MKKRMSSIARRINKSYMHRTLWVLLLMAVGIVCVLCRRSLPLVLTALMASSARFPIPCMPKMS